MSNPITRAHFELHLKTMHNRMLISESNIHEFPMLFESSVGGLNVFVMFTVPFDWLSAEVWLDNKEQLEFWSLIVRSTHGAVIQFDPDLFSDNVRDVTLKINFM